MEPNTKLLIKELMKKVRGEIQSLQKEMKDGFTEITAHEVAVNTRISELATAVEQREERVALLESTATEIDKMLTVWKPEVESSLSSIRLQLSKLNDYLERDNKPTDTSSPGTFTDGATSSHSSPGSTAAALMGTTSTKFTGIVAMGVCTPIPTTRSRVRSIPPFPHLKLHMPWNSLQDEILLDFPLWVTVNISSPLENCPKCISLSSNERIPSYGSLDVRAILICMR
jgi:hypothetical protein